MESRSLRLIQNSEGGRRQGVKQKSFTTFIQPSNMKHDNDNTKYTKPETYRYNMIST